MARVAEPLNFPGYAVQNVVGDGNCFYRALVLQLNARRISGYNHESLRQEIARYIEEHRDVYGGFVTNPRELDQIARDRTWAGEVEIRAAAMSWH